MYNNMEPVGTHGNPLRLRPDDVDNYTLADYGWTPEALKSYMFGVPVVDPATGEEMGDAYYQHYIEVAVAKAEKELDIAILPRFVQGEHHDFHSSDFNSYMYTHTYKRPILYVSDFTLEMSGRRIYNYNREWWRVSTLAGHIEIMPTALMQSAVGGLGYDVGVYGMPMHAGLPVTGNQNTYAPQMVHVDYVAGLLPRKRAGVSMEWEVPADLEQLVLKYALVEVFQQWGRLIIGAGIAGRTLSIDGISETIQTTQSAMYTGSSADILLIKEDIAELEKNLRSYFGISFGII